jgi:hypothetical protein
MVTDRKITFIGFTSHEQMEMVSKDALSYSCSPKGSLEEPKIEVYSLDSWLEKLCWWQDRYYMVVEYKLDEDGSLIAQRTK